MNMFRLTRYLSMLLLCLFPFLLSPTTFAHTVPTQADQITEYPLPGGGSPWGITNGPDGKLWFTNRYGDEVGHMTTQGKGAAYPVRKCCPISITTDPNGDLWYTVTYDDGNTDPSYIGRTTLSGKTTLYPLQLPDYCHPWGITMGPDGNIWFTVYMNEIEEDWNDYIGRMTPQGKVTLIPINGSFAHPFYIIPGPNGNLWFTEGGAATHGIVELNPYTFQMTSYQLYGEPIGITVGPDGDLWFTDIYDGNFGRLNPVTGVVNRFSIPTSNSHPWGIATGADGTIWFTEYTNNAIGRINANTTPTTMVTEFPIPTPGSQPTEIIAGPDGNLWFAESSGGNIGKITTS